MRDVEGRILSNDVIDSLNSFLLEVGSLSIDNIVNITNVHLTGGFYKLEFTEPNIEGIKYREIPEYFVKSFIRNRKIDSIL